VAVVLLPAVLAAEAGGQKRFELEAATVGDALRQLPVRNLLFDERGDLRRLINVFVDGTDVRGGQLLEEPVQADSEVRVVGAVAGGCACAAASEESRAFAATPTKTLLPEAAARALGRATQGG
jgi:molybdopterin converting factor small subunit